MNACPYLLPGARGNGEFFAYSDGECEVTTVVTRQYLDYDETGEAPGIGPIQISETSPSTPDMCCGAGCRSVEDRQVDLSLLEACATSLTMMEEISFELDGANEFCI